MEELKRKQEQEEERIQKEIVKVDTELTELYIIYILSYDSIFVTQSR